MGLLSSLFRDENKGSNLDVHFSNFGDYNIFFVKGEYISSRRKGLAKQILKRRESGKNLIIDLKEVVGFDTSGLASLVSVWRILKKEGNDLRISGADKRVIDYCDVCGVYRFFDFYESLEVCFGKQNSGFEIKEKSRLIYNYQ